MNKKRKTDVNGREGKRVRDPRRMKRRKIAKGEGGGEVGVVVVVVVVRGRKREREVEVRMKRERERERERRGVDGWREWSARKESCFFTAEVTEKGLEPEQGREKKKGDL